MRLHLDSCFQLWNNCPGVVEFAMKLKVAVLGWTGLLMISGALSAQPVHPNQPTTPRGAAAILWGDLKPGPFSVGFRVIYERDKTRNWLKPEAGSNVAIPDLGRPIRTSVWYPAAPGKKAQLMRYGDYFHFDGPDGFRKLNDELEKNDRESWTRDLMEVSPQGREILRDSSRLRWPRTRMRRGPAAGFRWCSIPAGWVRVLMQMSN